MGNRHVEQEGSKGQSPLTFNLLKTGTIQERGGGGGLGHRKEPDVKVVKTFLFIQP